MKLQNKIILYTLIFVLISSTLAASSCAVIQKSGIYVEDLSNVDYVPGQVVVLIKENRLGDTQIENMLRQASPVSINSIDKLHKYDLKSSPRNHGKRMFTLNFNENINPKYVSNIISKNSLVLIAEPEYIGYLTSIPNDPLFSDQWGLHNTGQNGGTPDADIDAPEAWDLETGSEDIIISIIDTGADLDHEDLVDKLLPGWDVFNHDLIPEDTSGHGTMVTGIAAASTNNNLGIAGTCPDCMILPVKAGNNSFLASNIYYAIEYSLNNPNNLEGIPENQNIANIISMQVAFSSPSTFLRWGVEDAYAMGVILVAGAGNNNNNTPRYPAAFPEVIGVAATDENDVKTTFSSYGTWVDVASPGINIWSTYLLGNYNYGWGTSFSTPFVSGVIGLILSKNPDFSNEEVRQILIDTSDPVTGFPEIIGGRINAYQALLATPEPNYAPDLFPIDNIIIQETEPVIIIAEAIDPNNDEIIFSINDSRFESTALPRDGDIQKMMFSWTTGYQDQGIYQFEVTASDGELEDTELVNVIINNKPLGGKTLPYQQYIPEEGY
ncbi:MAG: S8 family serine peptidase [Candidatus Woesearchaeota archaeon]